MKYMQISEFVDQGYLQELNRRFLHVLGLALQVVEHADGTVTLHGVVDVRDDPDGYAFLIMEENILGMAEKKNLVDDAWAVRAAIRQATLGWVEQPLLPFPVAKE